MAPTIMADGWRPFTPSAYLVKRAAESWELKGRRDLRRAVFCEEQALFHADDADDIDARAIPLVALSCVYGVPDEVVGTVRIHEDEPGVWFGSRLAVRKDFRHVARLGSSLIRLAVGSARGLGCRSFLAHVQSQNVPLFERLCWRSLAVIVLHGRLHHLMAADLAHYPPCLNPETGFISLARAA
jgi:putative N-acetyltransferase (TIGR04045 family)